MTPEAVRRLVATMREALNDYEAGHLDWDTVANLTDVAMRAVRESRSPAETPISLKPGMSTVDGINWTRDEQRSDER